MTALPEPTNSAWVYQAVVYTAPGPHQGAPAASAPALVNRPIFATADVAVAFSREEAEAIFQARLAARQHPFEVLLDSALNLPVHPLVPVLVYHGAGQETIYKLTLTALSEEEVQRLEQIPEWRRRWNAG